MAGFLRREVERLLLSGVWVLNGEGVGLLRVCKLTTRRMDNVLLFVGYRGFLAVCCGRERRCGVYQVPSLARARALSNSLIPAIASLRNEFRKLTLLHY